MKSLKGLALRLFRANKFIVFSSILSIAIASMLALSMVLFSFNAQSTLKAELRQMYGDMDLSVGFNINQNKVVSPSLTEQISKNKKVEQLSRVSVTHVTVDEINSSIYTAGVENSDLAKSRYHFKHFLDHNSVAINKGLAKTLHAKVGDKVSIQGHSFTLVELINDLDSTGIAPDMILMNQKTAKEYNRLNDHVHADATYLLIKATKETNVLTLSNEIKSYDKDLRIDITEQDPFVKSNLQSLQVFVIVLSFLVLIVTSLLIISNFELLLYKMKNQFAIMRSLGATTKQISQLIFTQSIIINFSGICIGLLGTFLSQKYVYAWMGKFFKISSSPTQFHLGIALIISLCSFIIIQLFLLIPSYRSAKILPLKVMQKNERLDFGYSKARVILFKILIGVSLFLIIASQVLPTRGEYGVFFLLSAAVLVLLAFFIIFPVWLPKILEGLLPFGQKIFGREYYIAIKNLIPQIKKNTLIVLTISSLMIIAVFGSVTLRTIQVNEQERLKNDFRTPIVVNTRLSNTKIDSRELTNVVEKLPDVKSVSNFSTQGLAELQVKGKHIDMDYAVVDLQRLQAQGLMSQLKKKPADNSLIISERFAKQNDLKVGQNVQVGEFSNATQAVEPKGSYKVTAIEKKMIDSADAYVDWNNGRLMAVDFYSLYVDSAHIKDAVNELEGIKSQFPEIKISNYEQSVKQATSMFYQRWGIFIVVIATLVVCTMVGVFNSLANNIYSKRKEYAVLRTMGVKPKGIRNIVLSQVTTYIIIGLVIGVILGIVLTYILLLVDPGKLIIDYRVIAAIIVTMITCSTVLFTYLGNKIGNQNISLELTNDNK
ncbi:ABC transporter permease [Priestia megaterium]|uniref:FtsX-like permease family protein n=1 Tax=Priestia megaterium TaxID=1404 RepID=UPI000BF87931|nr:FtsX-like permease family protein [Priestia megaterium]MDP9580089.1 putative ABC transport system permease protein [Bacillus sp. 1751]PFE34167.1 ABC transporter permease [Priestia megaterium]PFK46707.1 ABC transporter permease [Priestia megaterium]PGO61119.1 ABC transporter permease [Priestia megaterium]